MKSEAEAYRAQRMSQAGGDTSGGHDVSQQARQPKGSPEGGEFAPGNHATYGALTKNKRMAPETPAAKPNSKTNIEVGRELQAQGQNALKALGIESGQVKYDKKVPTDPVKLELVAGAIAHEIQADLQRAGKSAKEWYTATLERAMRIASIIYPEVGSKDPFKAMQAKLGLTLAMSITSQGEKVQSNTRLSDLAYTTFRDTGKFPTNLESQSAEQMNNNFMKANILIGKLGAEKTRDFLAKEFTVRELGEFAGKFFGEDYKVSGESMDTKVYGSAIFGPKVGQGFYQNLNGNYTPLTMDMWFMRAFSRLTGTLTDFVDPTKSRDRLTEALSSPPSKDRKFTKLIDDVGKASKDPVKLLAQAKAITAAHDKFYKEHRDEYKEKTLTKPASALAAAAYIHAIEGLRDSPGSGGERTWIRGIFSQAQQKLSDVGIKLTIADMQATWWYPEKDLFAKMGASDSTNLNSDYAEEFSKLAIEKYHVPKEKIELWK